MKKIILIICLLGILFLSGCTKLDDFLDDFYCSEYTTVCHYEPCNKFCIGCKCGWICGDVCIEYRFKELPKNQTSAWDIVYIEINLTTTTTTIEENFDYSEEYHFETYYGDEGEIRYKWICKECGYVYDTDTDGLEMIRGFLDNHVCLKTTTTTIGTTTTTILDRCRGTMDCSRNGTLAGCVRQDCNWCCCIPGGICSCTLIGCYHNPDNYYWNYTTKNWEVIK